MTHFPSVSLMKHQATELEILAMAARASGEFSQYARDWAAAQKLRGEIELIAAKRRAMAEA
jgi:hypothetical protein